MQLKGLYLCLPDQTRTVLTKEELKQLRTECMGLSEILIQGCDVKLTVLLAEGISLHNNLMICLHAINNCISIYNMHILKDLL